MSNINKNIKTKTGAIVMVGAVLAAALLAAFAFSPTVAFAQETTRNNGSDDRQHRIADKPNVTDEKSIHRPGLHFVKGAGVAKDKETGGNFRSLFMVITQKLENNDDNEDKVLRGLITLLVGG